MLWFVESPGRFIQEQDEIKKLETEVEWFSHVWRLNSSTIEVDFDIKVHNQTFEATLTYPNMFPITPAFVTPRDNNLQWSNHQYGPGGSLCLEWRSDNWRQEITGADLIKSAYNLLLLEKQPDKAVRVPSAHLLTLGQELRHKWQRFVVTNDFVAQGENCILPSVRPIKLANILNIDSLVMFVSAVTSTDGTIQRIRDVPAAFTDDWCFASSSGDGYWYQHEGFDTAYEFKCPKDLKTILKEFGFSTEDIVVHSTESNKYASRVIILQGTDHQSFRVFKIPALEELQLSEIEVIQKPKNEKRLPKNCKQFENLKVGIIGLGSVGSKVAVSLVRSGIKDFVLIDDDYLEIGNLVRHELSFNDVGRNKVDAVASAMNFIGSELKIATDTTRIHGQESSIRMASTLQKIAKCDIIIDATANPDVFLIAASIAKTKKIPLFWAEVFARGCGGYIARAHPSFDPNPLAIRDGFNQYLTSLPPAPFKQATGYDGDDDKPSIAFDCDVTFIASALTRLAIDSIDVNTPNKFSYPLYLIGMSKEWDFKEPFDTRPLKFDGESWNDTSEAASQEDLATTLNTIKNMIDYD